MTPRFSKNSTVLLLKFSRLARPPYFHLHSQSFTERIVTEWAASQAKKNSSSTSSCFAINKDNSRPSLPRFEWKRASTKLLLRHWRTYLPIESAGDLLVRIFFLWHDIYTFSQAAFWQSEKLATFFLRWRIKSLAWQMSWLLWNSRWISKPKVILPPFTSYLSFFRNHQLPRKA